MSHVRIGASLRLLRESAGLSADELAAMSDVTAELIENVERGAVVPSPHFVSHIVDRIGARLLAQRDEV